MNVPLKLIGPTQRRNSFEKRWNGLGESGQRGIDVLHSESTPRMHMCLARSWAVPRCHTLPTGVTGGYLDSLVLDVILYMLRSLKTIVRPHVIGHPGLMTMWGDIAQAWITAVVALFKFDRLYKQRVKIKQEA
jgi:hypothetical protein